MLHLNGGLDMPVSKKRKKKRPGQSRRRRPGVAMTHPLWEYRSIAEELAAEEPELTVDQALTSLLHSPYRLWDDRVRRIRTVWPSDMVGPAADSLHEWLAMMEMLHEGGFLSWDHDNQAHYLSLPA